MMAGRMAGFGGRNRGGGIVGMWARTRDPFAFADASNPDAPLPPAHPEGAAHVVSRRVAVMSVLLRACSFRVETTRHGRRVTIQ